LPSIKGGRRLKAALTQPAGLAVLQRLVAEECSPDEEVALELLLLTLAGSPASSLLGLTSFLRAILVAFASWLLKCGHLWHICFARYG